MNKCELQPRQKIILSVLHNKELSAAQIRQAVRQAAGRKYYWMGVGSIYRDLDLLEKGAYIEGRYGDKKYEDRGGARKRYYKLTKDGKRIVNEVRPEDPNFFQHFDWQAKLI